ncbi:hypothetical protein F4810DRAFT_127580 [Camillea tinctor]|nr:hypothetical protein F4810DRAFT_127580 [Camillea tinctor]
MPLQPQKSHSSAETGPNYRNRHSNPETSAVVKPALENRKWSTIFSTRKRTRQSLRSDTNYDTFPGSLSPFKDDKIQTDIQLLRKSIQRIKSKTASNVDVAYEEYEKVRDASRERCKALLNMSLQRRETLLVSPTTTTTASAGLEVRPASSLDVLSLADTRSSISTNSIGEALPQSTTHDDHYVAVVREWERCLQELSEAIRKSLQDTYNEHNQHPTPEGFERICKDKMARKDTIKSMRDISVSKVLSEDLGFFPKYDIRFRNYDQMKKDLALMHPQVPTPEPEISPEREIVTRIISASGDVMLEFANRDAPSYPVFRFRVSSSVLADKSSFFKRLFNSDAKSISDDHVFHHGQQSLPTSLFGSDVKLYSLPETELNRKDSLEILLHAAHGENNRLPRDIEFEQFVAIAEVCLRYHCTSPLEYSVEVSWLPQWADKTVPAMRDGLLLISYAFGLPADFTHLSRAAILHTPDDAALDAKPWPQPIRDQIRARRHAYTAQVYDRCRALLREYTTPAEYADPDALPGGILQPVGKTRCARGYPECDAANLGWIVMCLRDLGVLPHVLLVPAPSPSPSATNLLPPQSHPPPPPPKRSLAQLLGALSRMTSHVHAHGGVACDFAPAFRLEMRDIEACVEGLRLADVPSPSASSAPSHGQGFWALSRANPEYPRVFNTCATAAGAGVGTTKALEGEKALREDTRLRILMAVRNTRDLRALAGVNRAFYGTWRRNRGVLVRSILGRMPEVGVLGQRVGVNGWEGEGKGGGKGREDGGRRGAVKMFPEKENKYLRDEKDRGLFFGGR